MARRLVAEGASVALVDRDQPGSGATGRSAGFLLAGVAANYAEASERHGRSTAAEIWAFSLDNHRQLAEAIGAADCGYARRGSWVLPASAAERDRLLESAAMLREDGLPGEWHDVAPESGGRYAGGLLNPDDGEVDPARMLARLAAALPPGVIYAGHRVIGLEAGDGGVRVHLERGELEAGRVVVATNGYTPRLLAAIPIVATRAQMLATSPLTTRVADRPIYSDFGYRYWRQLDDRRVLVGGMRNTAFEVEVGDDDAPTRSLQERLEDFGRGLGITAAVTHRWAGTMGFTPDELPLVGAVPGQRNVFICGGYSGHGLGFAVAASNCLVDSWSDGRVVPAWLESGRFGTAGGAA